MENIEKEIVNKFIKNREKLIIKYKNMEISKKDYIKENHQYFIDENIVPYKTINSVEKGILNYQYYNMMAKYFNILAEEAREKYKDIVFCKKYLNESDYYYDEKDKTSFRILRLIGFENVEAYYIKMLSENLNNNLYEIHLKNYDYSILHSKSIWLINVLKKEKVFHEKMRESIIDHYVNEKY